MMGALGHGRYELLSELGQGGMATVYLARDTKLGQELAIKRLHPHFVQDSGLRRRLRAEALCSRRLEHPNALRVYDYQEEPGEAYLTMDYFPSRHLESWLNEKGPFSAEAAVSCAKPICEVLSAAHRQGIVHRDLKPHNILLSAEGDLRVADFGLARIDEFIGGATSTFFVGTPEYAAPELFGGGLFDHRADLYALGLILYRMTVGPVPEANQSVAELLASPTSGGSRLAREPFGAVPGWLRQVILRLTDPLPERRYDSAADLLDALRTRRAEPPSLARAESIRCSRCGAARLPGVEICPICSQPFLQASQDEAGTWFVMVTRPRARFGESQGNTPGKLDFRQLKRLDETLRELIDTPAILDDPEMQRALNTGRFTWKQVPTRHMVLFDRLTQPAAETICRLLRERGIPARPLQETPWYQLRKNYPKTWYARIPAVLFVVLMIPVLIKAPGLSGMIPAVLSGVAARLKLLDLGSRLRLKAQPLPAPDVLPELEALAEAAQAADSERLRRVLLEIGAQGAQLSRRFEKASAPEKAALGDASRHLRRLLQAAKASGLWAASLERRLGEAHQAVLERRRQELEESIRLRPAEPSQLEEFHQLQAQLEQAEAVEERFFQEYARLTRLSGLLRSSSDLQPVLPAASEASPEHWLLLAWEELGEAPTAGSIERTER